MPEITEDTPTKDIVVQGVLLAAPMPYTEGDTLTTNEAHVVNQTLHENLRNNFASSIKKFMEKAGVRDATELSAEQRAEIQEKFDSYAEAYEFGVRTGGTGRPVDPVEAQALEMATTKVKESLKRQGFKLKDVGVEKIRSLAEGAIESHPAFRQAAERIVAARKQAADELTVDVGAPVAAEPA
jgi:hypothetical protein